MLSKTILLTFLFLIQGGTSQQTNIAYQIIEPKTSNAAKIIGLTSLAAVALGITATVIFFPLEHKIKKSKRQTAIKEAKNNIELEDATKKLSIIEGSGLVQISKEEKDLIQERMAEFKQIIPPIVVETNDETENEKKSSHENTKSQVELNQTENNKGENKSGTDTKIESQPAKPSEKANDSHVDKKITRPASGPIKTSSTAVQSDSTDNEKSISSKGETVKPSVTESTVDVPITGENKPTTGEVISGEVTTGENQPTTGEVISEENKPTTGEVISGKVTTGENQPTNGEVITGENQPTTGEAVTGENPPPTAEVFKSKHEHAEEKDLGLLTDAQAERGIGGETEGTNKGGAISGEITPQTQLPSGNHEALVIPLDQDQDQLINNATGSSTANVADPMAPKARQEEIDDIIDMAAANIIQTGDVKEVDMDKLKRINDYMKTNIDKIINEGMQDDEIFEIKINFLTEKYLDELVNDDEMPTN